MKKGFKTWQATAFLASVKLLLTTHVNDPFHGLKCKVGEQLSNTFLKSIHIYFTKDFNEVLFLQLKNEEAFHEV